MDLRFDSPFKRLQELLSSDWRIEKLLNALQLASEDDELLHSQPSTDDLIAEDEFQEAGIASRSEQLRAMAEDERQALRDRLQQTEAVAKLVQQVSRKHALPKPRWRWLDEGVAHRDLAPALVLKGRRLLRSVAFALSATVRMQRAALARKLATAKAEATETAGAINLYGEIAKSWASRVLSRPIRSCYEGNVQLDLHALDTSLGARICCRQFPGGQALVHRSMQLKMRVKTVLDMLEVSLQPGGISSPPSPLVAFLDGLTRDGTYYPRGYLFATEQAMLASSASGAARWTRPFKLEPSESEEEDVMRTLESSRKIEAAPCTPVGPSGVAPALGGSPAAGSHHLGGAAGPPAWSPVNGPDPGTGRLTAWNRIVSVAPQAVARGIYGPHAIGDFSRLETLIGYYFLIRVVIQGTILDPAGAGLGRPRTVKAKRNLQVLASTLYLLLTRIFKGLLPGVHGVASTSAASPVSRPTTAAVVTARLLGLGTARTAPDASLPPVSAAAATEGGTSSPDAEVPATPRPSIHLQQQHASSKARGSSPGLARQDASPAAVVAVDIPPSPPSSAPGAGTDTSAALPVPADSDLPAHVRRADDEISLARVMLPPAWYTSRHTVSALCADWLDEYEGRLRVWIAGMTAYVINGRSGTSSSAS